MPVRISGTVIHSDDVSIPDVSGATIYVYETSTLKKVGEASIVNGNEFTSNILKRADESLITILDNVYAIVVMPDLAALISALYPLSLSERHQSLLSIIDGALVEEVVFANTSDTGQSILSIVGGVLELPVKFINIDDTVNSIISIVGGELATTEINAMVQDTGQSILSIVSGELVVQVIFVDIDDTSESVVSIVSGELVII